MEINYEMIIKYLCKSTKSLPEKVVETKDIFITEKSVNNYNFPEKFKNIFNDESFYRYGVTTYDNETKLKNNISFWSSLLTLINKDFMIPYNNDENQMITEFKTQLLEQYKVSKLSSFIKKVDKIEMREKLKVNPDYIVLQYIVDVLEINFIIFDFKSEEYNVMYRGDIMNPWNRTFLFAKYENNWEPIMLTIKKPFLEEKESVFLATKKTFLEEKESVFLATKKIFDYNDIILKQLLNQTGLSLPKYYDSDNTKKEFMYIDMNKDDSNDNDSVHTDSESVEKFELPTDLNKTKLTKMKLVEVQELYTKLKLSNSNTKPTKPVMIESILALQKTIKV